MVPFHIRPWDKNSELRIGWASWDEGHHQDVSAKFGWRNKKDGRIARGGEVPVESLPALLAMAVEAGRIGPNDIIPSDLKILAEFFAAAARSKAT